ncbi:MAG: 4-aminobutyrate transaminase [Piccolia ochrophora]|nr:MAG: 4-aminobutyrate transaminase [Piccolia ochrophora]
MASSSRSPLLGLCRSKGTLLNRLRAGHGGLGLTVSAPFRRSLATATATATATEHGIEQPFFPDEPAIPIIRTEIPGPQTKKAIQDLDRVFDTRSLNMMANYQNSFGN